MKASHLIILLMTLVLMAFSSCSGNGSISASGGIDGSGVISRGSISGFGSVIVNGTEFDTSTATIIVNGNEAGIGDEIVRQYLDVGRVITVEGSKLDDLDTAVADQVIYRNNVKGPVKRVSGLDPITKEINVMGQTVIVNATTYFKGTTWDAIAPNDVIEVSGFLDNTGAIWATFIGKTGEVVAGLAAEVTGIVDNLNTASRVFEINGLTVDYSLADTGDLPGGLPVEGLFVQAEGFLDATSDWLTASRIQIADDLDAEDAGQIEVTGFVTGLESIFKFSVGHQPVQTDANAVFVDGKQEDVALGRKLEAEGTLVGGVLLAMEIEFWDANQIEVESLVTEVVSPLEFKVGDQLVQTDMNTIFEGGTSEDIAVGVHLEIKGVPSDVNRSVLFADKVSFEEQ